ncbi:aminotransferase class IV [Thalassospiraceae bacterium LMO-JJ14]|nr:aminotransferase class IV [Thalassospiraceae bacterium LMO-JJ14]
MTTPPGIAYINGNFAPMADARISVLDWGFLRSDATYDVVHVWQNRFFRLDKHIERFLTSIDRLHMTLPVNRAELEGILAECVRRSGHEDAYVEMILTRGVSPTFSRDPRDAVNNLICFAIPFGWIVKPENRNAGMNVAISDITRIPPAAVDPRVKNYHWLDFVMALYGAYERDADNVILLDQDGFVTEGPGFNVFVIKDGKVRTPDSGVLEGITRQTAIELARELQIPVEACPLPGDALRGADEVFATSTAGGLMAVTTIDGVAIGDGTAGPTTRRLTELYWAKHADPAWSTAVSEIPTLDTASS